MHNLHVEVDVADKFAMKLRGKSATSRVPSCPVAVIANIAAIVIAQRGAAQPCTLYPAVYYVCLSVRLSVFFVPLCTQKQKDMKS